MSRSFKSKKPSGFEYWSSRPGNKHGGIVGVAAKKFTHRRERKIGNLAAQKQSIFE